MLKLRRAIVLDAGPPEDGPEQHLLVELRGDAVAPVASRGAGEPTDPRPAIADVAMHGLCQVADEVIVNVQALDLRLGSGGFDVLHVNLTRGLGGEIRHRRHPEQVADREDHAEHPRHGSRAVRRTRGGGQGVSRNSHSCAAMAAGTARCGDEPTPGKVIMSTDAGSTHRPKAVTTFSP